MQLAKGNRGWGWEGGREGGINTGRWRIGEACGNAGWKGAQEGLVWGEALQWAWRLSPTVCVRSGSSVVTSAHALRVCFLPWGR